MSAGCSTRGRAPRLRRAHDAGPPRRGRAGRDDGRVLGSPEKAGRSAGDVVERPARRLGRRCRVAGLVREPGLDDDPSADRATRRPAGARHGADARRRASDR